MSVVWFDGVTLTFEIGFSSTPSTAIGSTTWTDVSADVRRLSTVRGRPSELEQFQAGHMTVVLDNRLRKYDPNNAAGPFTGNLKPMRRARLRATYNAVTYDVWSGFVDDWPQSYELGDADATVTLECTDGFKVLANRTTPVDELTHLYLETTSGAPPTPNAWYRLGEQSGSTCLDSSGNALHGVYGGGATFNTRTGLIQLSEDHAIQFDAVDDYAQLPMTVTAYPITIAFWFSTTTATGNFVHIYDSTVTRFCTVQLSGGAVKCQIQDEASNRAATTTATGFNDGLAHFVLVTATASAAPVIYVDGVSQATTTSGSGTITFPSPAQAFLSDSTSVTQTLDEVAWWDTDQSTNQLTIYSAGSAKLYDPSQPVDGVTTAVFFTEWPTADIDFPAATTNAFMWFDAVAFPGPKSILEACRACETFEQGQFYVDGAGKLVFREHTWRHTDSTAVTSQATFGDSGVELPYFDIQPDGGAQFIRNRIRVTPSNSSTVSASDATSIGSYLEWTDDVDFSYISRNDGSVPDTLNHQAGIANWRLAQFKDPIQRIAAFGIKPRALPASLFPQVLGRKIGERVTVKRRPPGGGAVNTYTVLIEGIRHDIDADGEWTTYFNLSSADTLDMFLLDTSLLDTGRLGF